MGNLADKLHAHLGPRADDPRAKAQAEAERRRAGRELCAGFERCRREVIFPAMSDAHDALRQNYGRRCTVELDRSEQQRGAGAFPAVFAFDDRPYDSGEEMPCRIVFGVDLERQLVHIERRMGLQTSWLAADGKSFQERDTWLPLEEVTCERVGDELLAFIQAALRGYP